MILMMMACAEDATTGPATGDTGSEPTDSPAVVVSTLVPGSSLPGSNGMAMSPDGAVLYVAGANAARISRLDAATGELLGVWGPEIGLATPDDVAVDADGAVYWTELLTGEVGRIGPDGVASTIGFVAPGVNPIAFAEDGRLFVATCLFSDAVYEVDPTGATPPRLVAEGVGDGTCALNGAKFGPDGRLYGAQPSLGRVVALDVDTGEVEVLAEGLSNQVYGVALDAGGLVYAVDGARVVRLAGGAVEEVTSLAFVADNLLFAPDGRLFVSSVGTAEVVSVEGGVVAPFAGGGLSFPQGLALVEGSTGSEELLVVNAQGLSRYDPQTGEVLGLANAQPFVASSFTASPERWVSAVPFGFAVYTWDPTTAAPAPLGEGYVWPTDALSVGDEVWVAEAGLGFVSAVPLADPASRAPIAMLEAPGGLLYAGGVGYASEVLSGEVVAFLDDAGPIVPPRVVASGLDRPSALAADGDQLLVREATRVLRIDPDGVVTTLVDGLTAPNPPLLGFPTDGTTSGLAVGTDGRIYVADPLSNRILIVE